MTRQGSPRQLAWTHKATAQLLAQIGFEFHPVGVGMEANAQITNMEVVSWALRTPAANEPKIGLLPV